MHLMGSWGRRSAGTEGGDIEFGTWNMGSLHWRGVMSAINLVDGGTTRFKGRKLRQNGATNATDDILMRIHTALHISSQYIIQLYHLDKPLCQGCRGNSKDFPNWFCGLVPPPTGTRKQGLWQKVADMLEELGSDPSQCLRTFSTFSSWTDKPRYNMLREQCLFMNTAFREEVFAAEADLLKHQLVLHQLTRLFAQLDSGKESAVDSAPFASTLELDNAVQQDGQEFLKLLLTSLERVFGSSPICWARNLVQNVFRGTFSYVTKCGQESDTSKDAVEFYELELNVQGFPGLHESLHNYLREKNLRGENQYSCESCKMRVNATDSMKLRSLPPVLTFQLKRFVFNAKTATKKVSSKFSFPRSLDMGAPLNAYSLSEDASSPYDDEQVSSLGSQPLGEISGPIPNKEFSSGNDVAALMQSDISMIDNGEEQIAEALGGERSSSPRSSGQNPLDMLISADAYMLMYSCRGPVHCRGVLMRMWISHKQVLVSSGIFQCQNNIDQRWK